MILNFFLIAVWLLVSAFVTVSAIGLAYRWFKSWLNQPDEPPLPPPDTIGAECVVLLFAEKFVDIVSKSQVPQWQLNRYFKLSDCKLAPIQKLSEAMLTIALIDLHHRGFFRFRLETKNCTSFDRDEADRSVMVSITRPLPLTPLGRSFAVGFRQASRPIFLLKKPSPNNEVMLEDMVEFALREIRRVLGWRKAKKNNDENLINYVHDFLLSNGNNVSDGSLQTLENALKTVQQNDPKLAEAIKENVKNVLYTLQRLEGDREV